MLHDYSIAHAGFVNLPRDFPFRFTLLAAAAIRDANLVSEFGKVRPTDSHGVVLAAAARPEALAVRNADLAALVFPHIRRLLSAMRTAVRNGFLDAESNWLTHRSILTLPESCAHFDWVLHFALLGLADPEDRSDALSWLEFLWPGDRTGVVGGLWRIPAALRPPGGLLPAAAPAYSLGDDPLAVADALAGKLTTPRLLLLATAFVGHPEPFAPERHEWVRLLAAAGDAVFALALGAPLLAAALDSGDLSMRFAGAFVAHRLTAGSGQTVDRLMLAARGDPSGAVRLMSLVRSRTAWPRWR
jgi:hypothetical protein